MDQSVEPSESELHTLNVGGKNTSSAKMSIFGRCVEGSKSGAVLEAAPTFSLELGTSLYTKCTICESTGGILCPGNHVLQWRLKEQKLKDGRTFSLDSRSGPSSQSAGWHPIVAIVWSWKAHHKSRTVVFPACENSVAKWTLLLG